MSATTQRVCLIRGDGIGDELLDFAARAIHIAMPDAELDEVRAGFGVFEETGAALPPESLIAAQQADACLLVAVGSPLTPTPGYSSPIVALRRGLDLFANIRPVKSLDPADGVDLIIVRENTEGLYIGRETSGEGWSMAERVVTEAASRRIARVAGQLASGRRGRVAVVHKANVLRETCGLFRATALDELSNFPGVEVEELLVDNAALQLVANPERFDVLVTTNLFGDILSDVAAHAGGGLGLVTSANLGADTSSCSLFEPVHGSAPDLVGTGRANPIATLRASAWLIHHLGHEVASNQLTEAIDHALALGPHTPDMGGRATTGEVAETILSRLQEALLSTTVTPV